MKKLITILFLLISIYVFGQEDGKPRYTQLKPIPASHITDLQDSINANTKLAGIEAGAQVNVAETDPVFTADSAQIVHWSDTLTTPGIATKADVENATITETDPIVGAITGIPKSNGAGTISQAVGDTDYLLPNTPITGATKTKITYDAQGLVTSGADATTADIAASTDKNYVTDAEAVVIGNTSGTNTGDQTITLTGDVTGSGTGSFATTIAASAVTLAKMADVATGTVFYRKTAATGVPEVQTLATLKTDLGLTGTNSGDQTITLTGDVTGSGTGSFAATIGADKILESMLKSVNTPTDEYALTYESTTGDFEWQEMTAGFTDPMTTAYDLIWKNGSNVTTRLPIGTNGNYLGIASGVLGYKQILGSEISNTESWTPNVGTVTSVIAGNGMTQSGTSTINPTLNVVSHAGAAGSIGTVNIGADAIGVNLGSTSTTAMRGDNGTTAYSHSQLTSGNPHSVTPTELSLVIGTNTQAYDAGLTNLAGVAMVADRFYYTSADNVHVAGTVTSFARTILDDADAATVRATIGAGTGDGDGDGDALVANPLSQFAATTSAQLAGVISDETGTGGLVFANSPVFTTPNIGSATGSISGNAATVSTIAGLAPNTATTAAAQPNITSLGTLTNLDILTTTGSEAMTITQYYADNANVYPALRLKRDNNTVTPGVDGIGVSLDFSFEDYATAEYKIGSIQFMRDGADTEGALEIWGGNQATDKFLRFEGSAIMQLPRYTSAVTVGSEVYNLSVDASGYVITTTPTTGTIGGSIADNQVAIGNGTNAVDGSSNLTFNGSTLGLTGSFTSSGLITANGGLTLGAGDDLIGSSTSDITINTNKFTVAGATGNTLVAGELDANGNIVLGAGSTIFGSSTSNITINTNKFVVTGSSGNTTIGGTLDVVGATTATGLITANGGANIYEPLYVGATIAVGDLCVMGSGGMVLVDADVESTTKGLLGIAMESGISTQTKKFLIMGTYTTSGLTRGNQFYISTTAGDWTATAPSAAGDYVRIVGHAISTTELYFNPDNSYILLQ